MYSQPPVLLKRGFFDIISVFINNSGYGEIMSVLTIENTTNHFFVSTLFS